uniref:Uncharacterized protein n=1 Tax=Noccaea caerulescens TaxID=107243 RepID=A0A1J3FL05_NOCCA
MWCARYHQPSPASSVVLNRQTKQKESLKRKQVLCFLSSSPSSLREHRWQIRTYPKIGRRLKTKASVVPPSESGDIGSFLVVSGAMISMYLVANFVVPSLLFKSLQVEEEEDSD